jgi:hypothetical protein
MHSRQIPGAFPCPATKYQVEEKLQTPSGRGGPGLVQKAVPLVLRLSSQRGKTKARTLLCCASKQWWESAFPEKAEPHKLQKERTWMAAQVIQSPAHGQPPHPPPLQGQEQFSPAAPAGLPALDEPCGPCRSPLGYRSA